MKIQIKNNKEIEKKSFLGKVIDVGLAYIFILASIFLFLVVLAFGYITFTEVIF